MKHIMFFLALLIVAMIALKVFFWAVGKIIILAVVVAAVYVGVRMFLGKKGQSQGTGSGGV